MPLLVRPSAENFEMYPIQVFWDLFKKKHLNFWDENNTPDNKGNNR